MKLNIKDSTNQELINAIVTWIECPELVDYLDGLECSLTPDVIVCMLKDGTWLDILDQRLEAEMPHSNS